jgi:cytochrome c oxidase subunit 3
MPDSIANAEHIAHQFDDIEQQREAGRLGMWVFISTEILLFGGLFLSYTVYSALYPGAFSIGSEQTDFWLGTSNTAVLLVSSLTMALAVHAAQEGKRRSLAVFLLITMALGVSFLGIKFYEYYLDYGKHLIPGLNFTYKSGEPPAVQLFFLMYFFMTGLHAVHMTIGISLLGVMTLLALKKRISEHHFAPIEIAGLYWHLIDIVWVFLYPVLYLAGRRHQ